MITNITGITWITTYNCNIACDHCFFDSQGNNKYMDPKLIDAVFKDFIPGENMYWQHLSGGEIFLKPDQLIKILEKINNHFKGNIGISTNGFWATDYEKASSFVKKLINYGVNGIAVSADHFHQKHLSLEGPKNLIRIIKSEGINTHSYIMGARLSERVDRSEEINSKSEQIARNTEQGLGVPFALAYERSIGKGSNINVPKRNELPKGKCTEINTCLGNRSPFNPAMVWIDPYGNVMICYGIIIGNVYKESFNNILEKYDTKNLPVIHALAKNGPMALYNLVDKKITSTRFFDECDLCYLSRKLLRSDYPEIFGPDECYPDN